VAAYRELLRLSPNRAPGPHERLGVLFHHSGMGFEETIAHMLRPESQVSYHVLVARDGTRCTLVPETEIAWHAGASSFLGRSRCNDFLLGVAFEGDTYREPLTADQLASAIAWLAPRWVPLGWALDRVTDHRQASPGRKQDLNPVEWDRLVLALRARFENPQPRAFPG
jgi:N-acetyl-anhydromuramoyl-L-alanine amidase